MNRKESVKGRKHPWKKVHRVTWTYGDSYETTLETNR